MKPCCLKLKHVRQAKCSVVKVVFNIFLLPVMHNVGDDGGKEAKQHDRRTGVHHWVQKLRRIRGERQHLLQILRQQEREEREAIRNIVSSS